jgi:hypothetical protein
VGFLTKIASLPRVYKYVADDGLVYWSFDRDPLWVSRPKKLTLQSRVGVNLLNHLNALRRMAAPIEPEDVDG